MLRPALLRNGFALSVVVTCFAAVATAAAPLTNVRANDLAFKSSETLTDVRPAVAMDGLQVVSVWNRGSTYSAYAWSNDGGRTYSDGRELHVANLRNTGDPAVTTDHAGNFYTASADGDLTDYENPRYSVHVRRGSFNAGSFAWDSPVRAIDAPSGWVFSQCALAADPSDGTLYLAAVYTPVLFATSTSTAIWFTRSTDHGATWAAGTLLGLAGSPAGVSAPRIAVGPDGEVVVLYAQRNEIGTSYGVVRRSVDRGTQFAAAVNVPANYLAIPFLGSGPPGSNQGYAQFNPSLAIDCSSGPNRGRIYVAWEGSVDTRQDALGNLANAIEVEPDNSVEAPMLLRVGSTLTAALSSTADLDWYQFSGNAGQTVVADLQPVPGGARGVATLALYGGRGAAADQLAYSTQGNEARGRVVFTLPTTGTYWLRVAGSPYSASPVDYVLRTGWHTPVASDVARDSRDIALMWSDDGTTWSSRPVIVNSDPGHFDNAMPEVAVDAAGQVHVIWYDHRDDVAQGRRATVYHAFSSDGGATFGNDERIDSGPGTLFALLPTRVVSHNMGSRIGLTSDGCRLMAAFTDGRTGRADVWTQVLYGGPASASATQLGQSADTTGTGSPVTFVAQVSPADAGALVQFLDGGVPVGPSVPVNPATGQARWVVQDLAVGSHRIGARFDGNGCFTASVATDVEHVVSPTNTYFAMAVQVVGSGTVTREPELDLHPRGTTVRLTATPAPGWRFAGWSGDVSDTLTNQSFVMEADHSVVATFELLPRLVYRWTPGGLNTRLSQSGNWTPARTAPQATDVLLFDNDQVNTVTLDGAADVGRVVVRGSTQAKFEAVLASELTIGGGESPQLLVEPGARLTLSGGPAVTLALAPGTSGEIAGQVDVSGGAHRLLAASPNALRFLGGAIVSTGAGFTGNLFGTGVEPGALESVEFLAGSTYVQGSGGHPFGANAPTSAVTFRPGSRYRLQSPTGASVAGRVYADFEHDIGATTVVGGLNAVSCDSLIVTRGTLRLAQGAPTRVRGDVRVNAGAALELAPATGTSTLSFEGTAPQHFRFDGAFSMSPAARWRLANPAGLALLADWTLERDLEFAGGRLDTGPYRLVVPD
ncbi:MAG: Ig-like domain repeat protein, partial [Candidatus Eisenbacteria bacterium]